MIETILGGLSLTIILFFLNEFVFIKKNLTGEWKTIKEIKETSYNPYKGLKIEFKIHLIQKGNEIIGSGEKIKDINQDGTETVFLRKNRVIINIDGYFERKYFGKSKVYFNISENGRIRQTRTTYILTLKTAKNLEGKFISTSADAKGNISMVKL